MNQERQSVESPLRTGAEITVAIVAFRSAKERSFAARKTTLIDAPVLRTGPRITPCFEQHQPEA